MLLASTTTKNTDLLAGALISIERDAKKAATVNRLAWKRGEIRKRRRLVEIYDRNIHGFLAVGKAVDGLSDSDLISYLRCRLFDQARLARTGNWAFDQIHQHDLRVAYAAERHAARIERRSQRYAA